MRLRSRWLRLGGVAALSAVTASVGLLPLTSTPANAAAVSITRFAGANRYDTASKIAQGVFGTADPVIVTTGLNFPDALAAAYLAGVQNAPILLTDPNTASPEMLAALTALKTKNVIIVGGTNAVSSTVESTLDTTTSTNALGGDILTTRISGPTRYDTAQAIDATPAKTLVGSYLGKKTAIIATGADFPDALFSGALSYSSHFPIILTDPASLSSQAQTSLTSLGIQQVVILGGTGAVSAADETTINGMGITTVFRAAGANRRDTAAKLAAWEIANFPGFKKNGVFIARDDSPQGFADALAMSAAAGKIDPIAGLGAGAPTDPLPVETATELSALGGGNSAATATIWIPGGTGAVPDTKAQTASADLSGTNPAAQTVLPQLVSAKILVTVTTSNATPAVPAGTYIQYVFSQNITTAVITAAGFHAWFSTGAPITGGPGAIGAGIDPTNPEAIDAYFPGVTSATTAAGLTLATVTGIGSAGPPALLASSPAIIIGTAASPAGQAAIGAAAAGGSTAGTTGAPDLVSVGNYRQASVVGSTAVDFTFDKPAFESATNTIFHLILASGADPNNVTISHVPGLAPTDIGGVGPAVGSSTPASGGTVAGGNGTTVLTVIFPDFSGTTPITASQVARGYVTGGVSTVATAVTATGTAACPATDGPIVVAIPGPLGAVCAPQKTNTSGHTASIGPDLTSVAIVPLTNGGATDSIVYTFDQPICGLVPGVPVGCVAPVPGNFGYYNSNGSFVVGGGVLQTNSSSAAQIALNVAPGSTSNAVGGLILIGAVKGANSGSPSGADEMGAANPATSAIAPGVVAAPQLVHASIVVSNNTFGVPNNSSLFTFSFNLAAAPLPAAAGVHLYDADGTELTCAAGMALTTVTVSTIPANAVVCAGFVIEGTATVPTTTQIQTATLATIEAGAAGVGAANTAAVGVPNPEGAVKVPS